MGVLFSSGARSECEAFRSYQAGTAELPQALIALGGLTSSKYLLARIVILHSKVCRLG